MFGSSASFTSFQTLPTPSPDASTHPRNSGSPMTNYFSVVGSRVASLISVLHSRNACFAAGKYFHQTFRGFTFRILLIGVIKIFLLGLMLLHVGFSQSIFLFVYSTPLLLCVQSCTAPYQSQFAFTEPVKCTMLRHQPSNLAPLLSLTTGLQLTPNSS